MLCVIAKLSADATERLARVRAVSARFDLEPKPLHGHITLATYLPDDDRVFVDACRTLIERTPAFSVYYEKLEILDATSIIVASPRREGALSALHEAIAARYGARLDPWTRRGVWYPHTTLLYHPTAELPPILRAMEREFTPFSAAVERIEFSRVTGDGYKIVGETVLKARSPAQERRKQ